MNRMPGLLLLLLAGPALATHNSTTGIRWQAGPIIDGKNYAPDMPTYWTGGFEFPKCGATVERRDGVHYATQEPKRPIAGTMALTYTITGENPVFVPTEGDGPRLALYFQRRGDRWTAKGKYAAYRWYSSYRIAIGLGTRTISVALDHPQWGPVVASEYNQEFYFEQAKREVGRAGFVFGGSVGAGHGVCVKSGRARFDVVSWSIGG